jgi:segment polarity protein dishevelled
MEETKIIYYMDDDKMPYLIKLNMAPDKATLKDFKNALNANSRNFKFFFQAIVDDFGVVKEEIMDDDAKMPCVNGRVVSWVIYIYLFFLI